MEERIVARTTVEILSRLTEMVDQHKLPRRFVISLNGNVLRMRGPEERGFLALAGCDPAAQEEALASCRAEMGDEGFSIPWHSRDMFIERELTGIEDLSEIRARGCLNITPVPDAGEQDGEGQSDD